MKFESARYQGMLKAFEEAYRLEGEDAQEKKLSELRAQFKKERIPSAEIENAEFVASMVDESDDFMLSSGPSLEVIAERERRLKERATPTL